jgi:hypothetical protein
LLIIKRFMSWYDQNHAAQQFDEKILPDGIHVGLEATNRTAQK